MTRTLDISPVEDRKLLITRTFDAPRRLVFDAMTKPEMLKEWMRGPEGWSLPHCEAELRAGGAWRYTWRHDDGREMAASGRYLEFTPPDRTIHTELFDEDWTGGETVITTTYKETNGRTTVTLSIEYSSEDARERVLKSPMAEGMETSYARLDALLKSRLKKG